MRIKMRRCSKCVLPDTAPNIIFDENGVCSYCKIYKKFKHKGEEELLKIIETQKSKKKKYDCMVAISGGRDSSFTLLKMVKDYGLRVLTFNYRSIFNDPQAETNIQNAVKILKVNLVTYQTNNDKVKKTFANNLNSWMKRPSPSMVPMICVPCKSMYWHILKTAKNNDIDLIFSGGNPLEESSFKLQLFNLSGDTDFNSHFTSTLPGIISEIIKNPSYFNIRQLDLMIIGYLFGNSYAIGPKIWGYNVNKIDIFHYIPWDENEILSRIKEELNWDYPHQLESTWRFDCLIGHLKDLMYKKTIGMTEKDEFYSKMIREGMITRDEALKRLERENKLYYDEIRQLLEKTGARNCKVLDL